MEQNTEALLRELAAKLGTTTEKLYGVLVSQAKVKIINNIIGIITNLIFIFIVYYLTIRNVHWESPKIIKTDYSVTAAWSDMATLFGIAWAANITVWVFCFFDFTSSVKDIISDCMNPEYGAIQEILDAVAKKE